MPAAALNFARLAARYGFDLPKLVHSLWVVLTAFLALLLAWSLGLDHPQWAAITVFVTIQPSRGQTIEKNVYRFLGTLSGSTVGLLLLLLANGNVMLISGGLALWSGACLFLGTLQRSYRSYGTVLAGYSAIIVAMNNSGPPDMVKWVALDRVSAIFIGVLAGIALGYLIAPALNPKEFEQKARRILADILAQVAVHLGQERPLEQTRPAHQGQDYPLIAAAAQLSAQFATLSSHRAGAVRLTGPLDDLLVCATNLLMVSTRAGAHPELAAHIQQAATALHGQSTFSDMRRQLSRAVPLAEDPALEDALLTLASAIPDEDGQDRGMVLTPAEGAHWQYDWRGATQAGLRILIVTGVIGALWAATGAPIIQFALISSAIVISLASSGVSPSRAMRDVAVGQLIAAVSALLCEKLLWAQGGLNGGGMGGLGQVLSMAPSFLLYALIRSHRRVSLSATDYALTLLLLLTPTHAPYVAHYPPLAKAAMAVSGGLTGYIAFRLLFPINATRRRKMLWSMIKTELQAIAAAPPLGQGSASAWRLRFVARFLKIVNWTFHETRGEPSGITMRKGLLMLTLGDLVFAMRRALRRADLPPGQRRALEACLRRISQTERETPQLARSLGHLRQRLRPTPGTTAEPADTDQRHLYRLCDEVIAQLEDLERLRHAKPTAPLTP